MYTRQTAPWYHFAINKHSWWDLSNNLQSMINLYQNGSIINSVMYQGLNSDTGINTINSDFGSQREFVLDNYQLIMGNGFNGQISDLTISNTTWSPIDVREHIWGPQYEYRSQNFGKNEQGVLLGNVVSNSDFNSIYINKSSIDISYNMFNVIDISGNFEWDSLAPISDSSNNIINYHRDKGLIFLKDWIGQEMVFSRQDDSQNKILLLHLGEIRLDQITSRLHNDLDNEITNYVPQTDNSDSLVEYELFNGYQKGQQLLEDSKVKCISYSYLWDSINITNKF